MLCGLLLLLVGMPLSASAARDLAHRHPPTLDGGVAFDGRQVAFLVSAERWKPPTSVQVFDPRGKLRFRFEPGHASAAVFLVSGDEATELWLFDGEATLHRYAMP